MKIINKKELSEIQGESKEQAQIKLADIYEVLINLDDRITKIEKILNLGGK